MSEALAIETLTSTQYAIINELATALVDLGATSGLIAIVMSWGDTLPENEILDMLKDWNKRYPGHKVTATSTTSTTGASHVPITAQS